MPNQSAIQFDAKRYVGVFGCENGLMAGQQIIKRLGLQHMLALVKEKEDGEAYAREWLTELLENPMRESKGVYDKLDGVKLEESFAVQYLRGVFIHEFHDRFKEHSTHAEPVNDRIGGMNDSILAYGKVFIVIDPRATDDMIIRGIRKLLPAARWRIGIRAGSTVKVGNISGLLRDVERILAYTDWALLKSYGFNVGSRASMAEALYPDGTANPDNSLKFLLRTKREKVMNGIFAADLQWSYHFRESRNAVRQT